jgi:hypothetical protein
MSEELIDMEGAPLTEEIIREGMGIIAQNFGVPDHMFISIVVYWTLYWMDVFESTCRDTGFELEYVLSSREYNKYPDQIVDLDKEEGQ